jgi:hypothetical protein
VRTNKWPLITAVYHPNRAGRASATLASCVADRYAHPAVAGIACRSCHRRCAPQGGQRAIRNIELIHATTQPDRHCCKRRPDSARQHRGRMRSGSSEHVDRSAGHDALLEALTRFTSSRTRALRFARRARVFTFLNAKGAQDAPPRSELVTQLNALLAPKGQSARA